MKTIFVIIFFLNINLYAGTLYITSFLSPLENNFLFDNVVLKYYGIYYFFRSGWCLCSIY